jgi:FHA domain
MAAPRQYQRVAKLDEAWLAEKGRTVRPTEPPRALFDRLKFVAGLVSAAPARAHAVPRLLWRNERREVMSLALPMRLVIGRDAGCGLTMANPRLSRRHCEITLRRGGAWINDLGSTNGTHLNGRRVTVSAPLRDGDLIEVGGDVLAFVR